MTSQITLYKSVIINSERNIAFDDGSGNPMIEEYPNGLDTKVINNFQYIKNALSIKIKINMEQYHLEMGEDSNDYNYCKIRNIKGFDGDENPIYEKAMYYFINNKTWLSQNTIQFELQLDTINTFKYNSDYIISPKSKIIRQHEDRFQNIEFTKKINNKLPTNITSDYDDDYFELDLEVLFPDLVLRINTGWQVLDIQILDTHTMHYLDNSDYVGVEYTFILRAYEDGYTGDVVIDIMHLAPAIDVRDLEFSFTLYNPKERQARIINRTDESLNVLLYKKEIGELHQPLNTSWNLIYKTKEELSVESDNPVYCYLNADIALDVKLLSSNAIDIGSLTTDKYYHIIQGWNFTSDDVDLTCKVDDEVMEISSREWNYIYVLVIKKTDSTHAEVRYYRYRRLLTSINESVYQEPEIITYIASATTIYLFSSDGDTSINALVNTSSPSFVYNTLYVSSVFPNATLSIGSTTDVSIKALNSVDRTDSKLIKIIKIPYSPSTYSYTSNILNISSIWQYDNSAEMLKLFDMDSRFSCEIISDVKNPITTALIATPPDDVSASKNIIYESKLYHSNYYLIKFVYDSFTYGFYLENIDIEKSKLDEYFTFDFVMTTTINSRFCFLFNDYEYKYGVQDYDKVLNVDRNNEVVIYNSTYLTYIRTGYNYDVKSLKRRNIGAGVGMTASTIGAIVSAIVGASSGNAVGVVAGMVGAGVSLATGLISGINNIASNESSFEQKQEQMRNESASAEGSNDIDLLEAYSNNRAKLVLYEPSDLIKSKIFDLFYFYGYANGKQGIPNISSRYWFNYVEADLEIVDSSNLPEFVDDDIKNRFIKGITFMHMRKNEDDEYDTDYNQELENIEISLL